MANKPLELKKIFKINILSEEGCGLRSIMRKLKVSDTSVRKYREIYDQAKQELNENGS